MPYLSTEATVQLVTWLGTFEIFSSACAADRFSDFFLSAIEGTPMTTQILVPLHTYPDGNSNNIAAHVAVIARHLKADVHGLVLNATFPPPPMSSLIGDMIINVDGMVREATDRCRSRGAGLVMALEQELGPIGIKFRNTEIDCTLGAFGRAAEDFARYHDMIVTALSANDATMVATAQSVVFGSGRPTLLIPQDLQPSRYHNIMIAWDGSRVAARAVADSRDFLQLAKKVYIVVVTDEKTMPAANQSLKLFEYLGLHDIDATVALVQSQQQPIGRALQDYALENNIDMMVMGAFGHSRVRDFVIGGATTGIFRDLRLPVLLSH